MAKVDTIITEHVISPIDIVPTANEVRILQQLRTLRGADYEAQYFDHNPAPKEQAILKLGNPSTLGIAISAVANTLISLLLFQVRGIEHTNVVLGVLWFVCGLSCWLTAIGELLLGNTFGWCVFGSFGGYNFAYAATLTPSFGIPETYPSSSEYNQALGVFFCVWASLYLIFLVVSIRTNIVFVWILATNDGFTWLLAASYFQKAAGNTAATTRLQMVAGCFLFACSLGCWYLVILQLTESLGFEFSLPVGTIFNDKSRKQRKES